MEKVNLKHLLLIGILGLIVFNFTFEFSSYHSTFNVFSLKVTPKKIWTDPLFDNFPLLERFNNNACLKNDFFTNASHNKINPRWIFCLFIHYISKVFNSNYYNVLFFLGILFSFFIPVFYYLLIKDISSVFAKIYNFKVKDNLIFFTILIISIPIIDSIFSIAWWSPLKVDPCPNNVAVFLSLISWLTTRYELFKFKILNNFFSLTLLLISVFIHPVASLWFLFFTIIIYPFDFKEKIYLFKYRIFIVSFVFIVIAIIFKSKINLSSKEFIDIYCLLGPHPKHYLITFFLTPRFIDWKICLLIVFILMLIPLIYFICFKMKSISSVIFRSILVIFLVIFLQWFFIYVFPSKHIATIAPIRYVPYFYWTISIIWVLLISKILSSFFVNKLIIKLVVNKNKFFSNYRLITVFIFIFLIIISNSFIDNPKQDIYLKDKKFYDFLSTTKKNATFISNDFTLNNNIPLIGKRPVFVGSGFPFNEDYFLEFKLRDQLVFGPINYNSKIKNDIILRSENFNQKGPLDFIKISKVRKLDYVIITKYIKKNIKLFINYRPVFEDDDFAVYNVHEFK